MSHIHLISLLISLVSLIISLMKKVLVTNLNDIDVTTIDNHGNTIVDDVCHKDYLSFELYDCSNDSTASNGQSV